MKKGMDMLILLCAILLLSIPCPRSYAFELKGFGSVTFTKSTDGAEEFRHGDFAVGAVDLFLAESLEDIEVLSEIALENGVIDVERFTIGYTFSDALRVRAGRFHTPLGLWNITYHHGAQIQPTIDRPEFLKFEDDGGILPTHVVGVYLSGRASTGVGTVEYGAALGNGPKITSEKGVNILSPNNIEDNNIGKGLAFNAALSPELVHGLKVSMSGHIAEIKDDGSVIDADNADGDNKPATGADTVQVDQTILNMSLMYSIADIDFTGEYFSIKDKDAAATNLGSFTNKAYYGLIRYTWKDKWVPYFLLEHQSVKENDPYLISLGKNFDSTESILGLRYNINYRSCVKGEARSVKQGSDNWMEYAVQWALAF